MQITTILLTVFLAAAGANAALNEPCYGAGGAPGKHFLISTTLQSCTHIQPQVSVSRQPSAASPEARPLTVAVPATQQM